MLNSLPCLGPGRNPKKGRSEVERDETRQTVLLGLIENMASETDQETDE
jgi:hypothetical protein